MVRYIASIRHFLTLCCVNKTLLSPRFECVHVLPTITPASMKIRVFPTWGSRGARRPGGVDRKTLSDKKYQYSVKKCRIDTIYGIKVYF